MELLPMPSLTLAEKAILRNLSRKAVVLMTDWESINEVTGEKSSGETGNVDAAKCLLYRKHINMDTYQHTQWDGDYRIIVWEHVLTDRYPEDEQITRFGSLGSA